MASTILLLRSFPWFDCAAGYDLVLVVDITGSMNARDYTLDGRPASRPEATKRRLRDLIARLPCRSRIDLGVFTERRSLLLFGPVELCGNFSAVDGTIAALDRRMAWEGGSHVASGFHIAIEIARDVGADLVFLTDGHEAPPLPAFGADRWMASRATSTVSLSASAASLRCRSHSSTRRGGTSASGA